MKKRLILITLVFALLVTLAFANNFKEMLLKNDNVSKVGDVTIQGNEIIVTNLVIKDVNVNYLDTNINSRTSNATLKFSDLEEAFVAKNKDIKEIHITETDNGQALNIKGKAHLLMGTVSLNLVGKLYIKNHALYYSVSKAQMNGMGLPKSLVNKMLERTNPFFKFSDISIPTYFNNVKISKNTVKLLTQIPEMHTERGNNESSKS